MKKEIIISMAVIGGLMGCRNQYGQLRPPDPLGRALFDLIDKPPAGAIPTSQTTTEYVVTPMPPMRAEAQPPAPGYGTPVWIDGYWGWNGSRWQWVPGHWVQPPHPRAQWMSPQYYSRNGQWYWRSGYWQ